MTNAKSIGIQKVRFDSDMTEFSAKEIQVSDNNVIKSTDAQLLELYESRDESAIEKTAEHYGAYCTSIAMNILRNKEDADECVNDTYLKAWNAIPPEQPRVFSSFIGRITRNLAINKYKSKTTHKRSGHETAVLLGELEDCIPAAVNVEEEIESRDLSRIIKEYLSKLREEDRKFFVCRYWYNDSVPEIAELHEVSIGKVQMSLHRTRKRLKVYLKKEGVGYEN